MDFFSFKIKTQNFSQFSVAIGFRRGGFVLLNVSLPNPLEMGPGNDGGLTVLINAQADTSRGLGSWVFSQPRVFPSNFITWDLCQPFTQHGITYHAATHVRVMDKEQHDDEENEEEEEGMEKSAGEKSSKYSSVESISLPSLYVLNFDILLYRQ